MRHVATSLAAATAIVFSLVACSDEPTRPTARPSANTSAQAQATPAAQFTITRRDLGTLGGRESRAIGSNDKGVVVGFSLNGAGQKRAFKWTAASGMKALVTLASRACQANHVNENGFVAGYCLNAAGQKRAVLWSASGQIRNLGTLPGGASSEATDVNDAGMVVGFSQKRLADGGLTTHPFRWTAAGGMRDITPTLGREPCGNVLTATAQRINRSSQVAGTQDSNIHDCGDVGPGAAFWSASNAFTFVAEAAVANGINDAGHVVGQLYYSCSGGPLCGAFRWTGSGQAVLLPSLDNSGDCGDCGRAFAINNAGLVVGESPTPGGFYDGLQHAVVWSATSQIQDLGTLAGGTKSQANDINKNNQVVGWSNKTGGAVHATLWTLR
jgi:probable HAF family extracellular repeat protein